MRARSVLIVCAVSGCTAERLDRHGALDPPKTPKCETSARVAAHQPKPACAPNHPEVKR